MLYARSPSGYEGSKPYIAEIVFTLNVEKAGFVFTFNSFIKAVFNHYNIYLGLLGIIFIAMATILSEMDYRRYSKQHAYLSFGALIATGINTYFIFTESVDTFIFWCENLMFEWWHLLHIVLGIIGFITCAYGAISGLSGIHHKKAGYLTLLCWSFNFGFGLIYWGVGLV
jgi:energy-coupling factor transporter transmembrane protein EcfT